MPAIQVSPETERAAAHRSQLQAAHAAAKARANKVCSREPGVLSIYALGELIAEIEDEAQQALAALDISAGVTGESIARRLKQLIHI